MPAMPSGRPRACFQPALASTWRSLSKAERRAKSHSLRAIQIDPARLEQFDRSMRENFTSGSIPFRKAYLQSLIDVIAVVHRVPWGFMWREIGNRTIRLRPSGYAGTSLH